MSRTRNIVLALLFCLPVLAIPQARPSPENPKYAIIPSSDTVIGGIRYKAGSEIVFFDEEMENVMLGRISGEQVISHLPIKENSLIFVDQPLKAANIVVNSSGPASDQKRESIRFSLSHSEARGFSCPTAPRPSLAWPCHGFLSTLSDYAAFFRSTATPIAQMNPSISRATAVTTCCLFFPFPSSRM